MRKIVKLISHQAPDAIDLGFSAINQKTSYSFYLENN